MRSIRCARSDPPAPIRPIPTTRSDALAPMRPLRCARSDPPDPMRSTRCARFVDPMRSIRSARSDAQLAVRRGLGGRPRREMPRKMCRRPSRAGGGPASRDRPRVRAREAAAHRDDRRGGGATASHSRSMACSGAWAANSASFRVHTQRAREERSPLRI